MLEFDQSICGNLREATGREWLETNGLGGYASATISGMHTRRYHGLLVAATKPPVGRVVMLAKLEETLVINGERFDLSVNQYPGVIHPQGYQYLRSFRLAPFPVFTYEVAGVVVEKSVFMPHGENTVVVQYHQRKKARGVKECRLEIHPLVAFRDYHGTAHENSALSPHVAARLGQATIQPYAELPPLHIAHNAEALSITGYWYRNFEYQAERERGLDYHEDLFNPFKLAFDFSRSSEATVIASTQPHRAEEAESLCAAELARRSAVANALPKQSEFVRTLLTAADQFIVARGEQKTIIAGYHWFSDWGRDTMIALPGLTLTTKRYDVAKSILLAFAQYLDQGMLPNRFPDAGEAPEYNTVDATLWYIEAVRALVAATGDYEFVREQLYDKLVDIIAWHERGTRYQIRVDADGLLFAGEPGVQLTWMDAKVGEWVVTPRIGKPVEIQALWYNALCVMQELAVKFGDAARAEQFGALAARARNSFQQAFWNDEADCLYDVVNGETRDSAIRPNQILAVSLPYTMLDEDRARRMVAVVERALLTPVGLRSLSPNDPSYVGKYQGGVQSRDGAYHQGTVWAWLMGPFIKAYLRVHGRTPVTRRQTKVWLSQFGEHLRVAGLNQISEIFDGEAPHEPRGCIAQAWSIAEILRVAVEEKCA